ncbi:MAG TPA: PDZ domain-containing protein, partial [Anaerolineales bacterium]|nr:PDZ domain-containing protein [Anaerolineales bacterium]
LELDSYTGAYVLEVTSGGPADLAGVKAGETPSRLQGLNAGGDLIIAFDGKPVNTFDELLSYLITSKSPGDTVLLTVIRDGEQVDLTITLGERP